MRHPRVRLPEREKVMLDYIEHYYADKGYSPSMRELATVTNTSTSVVDYHLRALEREGYIAREREQARSIRLLRSRNGPTGPAPVRHVPLLGAFIEGQALQRFSESTTVELSSRDVAAEAYAVRVHGSDLTPARIVDGDVLIVEPKAEIKGGDFALLIFGEQCLSLRRVVEHGEHMVLEGVSQNPIDINATKSARFYGKAIKLVRDF
jgi:repressor LexA